MRKWEHLEKKTANYKNHRQFTLRCLSQKITPNSLKLKSNIKTTNNCTAIRTEFGRESVAILRKWEHLEKKTANYKNHRQFTLRCLSQITPNSLKLKSNIKTTRRKWIIERVEKQLVNEWVRSINNTIETCSWQKDTCIEDLKCQISTFYFQECEKCIDRVKEQRHQSVLERQLSKFEQLWQRLRGGHSNNKNGHSKIQYQNWEEMTSPINSTVVYPEIAIETTSTEATNTVTSATSTTISTAATTNGYVNKWVRNLSGTPLTEAKVSLLVHSPSFAFALRHPPWGVHHHDRAGLPEARAT